MEELRRGYLRYRRTNVPTPPAFTEGILTHLLQMIGGKNVKVSSDSLKPDEVIYEARWDY